MALVSFEFGAYPQQYIIDSFCGLGLSPELSAAAASRPYVGPLHVDVVELKISFVAKDGHSENTCHRNPGRTLESLGGLFLLKAESVNPT